ncbi:hypothetical protein GCM10027403_34270 [Arthrobacter tecti]
MIVSRTRRVVSSAAAALVLASITAGSLVAVPASGADLSFPLLEPATSLNGVEYPDRFIVKFKGAGAVNAGVRHEAYLDASRAVETPLTEVKTMADGAAVATAEQELTAAQTQAVLQEFSTRPDVEYAEVDRWVKPAATPTDPFYPDQWNLSDPIAGMRLNAAWDRSTGAGVRVAVIDTGITTHRDLAGNVIGGYDFVSDLDVAVDGNGRDNNPQDPGDWCDVPTGNGTERVPSSWHGTHVAGIVAAQANNGVGVTGVAYGAKVQPVRALGACGGWESDIADAIVWAAGGSVANVLDNPTPAKVINLSLGADGACDGVFQSAIDTATELGAVVVVAAGNEDQNVANVAPANCANVISVGATGRDGARALYSNFGAAVDVSAPGGDFINGDESGILSTWNTGNAGPASESYAFMEGTSMAAPHVAGAAALMLALNPTLSPAQVETLMKQSVRPLPVPCSLGCGTGLVDGTAAVTAASVSLRALVAPTPTISGFSAVGYPLDAIPGSWAAGTTFKYQWYRSGIPIFGATGSRHNVTSADIGTVLSVKVTGSKPGYSAAGATSKITLAVPTPFVDVKAGRIFHREISWMAARHISLGWNNDDGTSTYRPLLAVNRDVMARFMYRLAGSPAYKPPVRSPFTDVPTTHVFYKEIAWLAESKVSEGWANRNGTRSFRPYEPVNRDVMAVFMYRLAGFNEYDYAPPARSPFVDVPTIHVFYKEIAWLAEYKISEGWSVGGSREFRPYNAVNRDVMAAFMYRFDEKFDPVQLAPAP